MDRSGSCATSNGLSPQSDTTAAAPIRFVPALETRSVDAAIGPRDASTGRHQPRAFSEPLEEPDGVLHTGRSFVVERCRDLHAWPRAIERDAPTKYGYAGDRSVNGQLSKP